MADIRSIYRIYVHPILSIFIPFFFLSAFAMLGKDLFAFEASPPYLLFAFLFVVGIEETAIGNALIKERASSIARLREIILIMIACFLIMALVPSGKEPAYKAFKVFLYLLLTFFQWLFSFYIQNNFRHREVFLGIVGKKNGQVLKDTLRNSGSFAGEINSALLINRTMFSGFIIALTVLLLFSYVTGYPIHTMTVVISSIAVCLCLAGIASVNMFINDLYIFSAGVNIKPFYQQRRMLGAFVWLVFIFITAAVLSSDNSFLPVSLVSRFFDWLRGFFPEPRNVDPRLLQPPPRPVQGPALSDQMRYLSDSDGGIDLTWLFILIERILVVTFFLGVAFFLIAPLLRGEGASFFRKYNPVKVFPMIFGRLFFYLRYLWRQMLLGFRKPALMIDGKKIKKDKYGFIIPKDKTGILKSIERNFIIRMFIKLTLWGRKKGSPWHGHGPSEYTNILSSAYPEYKEDLDTIGAIFEEAVFSRHLVGSRKIETYRVAVKRVLKR